MLFVSKVWYSIWLGWAASDLTRTMPWTCASHFILPNINSIRKFVGFFFFKLIFLFQCLSWSSYLNSFEFGNHVENAGSHDDSWKHSSDCSCSYDNHPENRQPWCFLGILATSSCFWTSSWGLLYIILLVWLQNVNDYFILIVMECMCFPGCYVISRLCNRLWFSIDFNWHIE